MIHMIKGDTYYCDLSKDGSPEKRMIFQFDAFHTGDRHRISTFHAIHNMNNRPWAYSSESNLYVTDRLLREATQEEINWLNACIKAKQYVEKPKEPVVNDSYSIF